MRAAVDGHSDLNSDESSMHRGAQSLGIRRNPNLSKNASAVVVSKKNPPNPTPSRKMHGGAHQAPSETTALESISDHQRAKQSYGAVVLESDHADDADRVATHQEACKQLGRDVFARQVSQIEQPSNLREVRAACRGDRGCRRAD